MDRTPLICASLLSLLAVFGQNAVGQSTDAGTLNLTADIPVVEVRARSPGRRFIRLPSVEYRFDVEAQCAADLVPRGMSLSIADTRKSLTADDMSAGEIDSITLKIPAPQIGPVAVDSFCIVPDGDPSLLGDDQNSDTMSLKVTSVLSAQASLLCANDTDRQMIYASKSLDVTLLCKFQVPEETGADSVTTSS